MRATLALSEAVISVTIMADTHNKLPPFLAVSLRWVSCHFVVFIMAAAVSALVFIIMYSQRSAVPRQSHKANVATQNQGSNFFSGVGLVIVIFLLSTLFWSYFEIGGGNLYQAFPQIMSRSGSSR